MFLLVEADRHDNNRVYSDLPRYLCMLFVHYYTLLLLLQNTVQTSNRVFCIGMYNIKISYQVHIYCDLNCSNELAVTKHASKLFQILTAEGKRSGNMRWFCVDNVSGDHEWLK